jgi:predicted metalloprotease with PDZ domain
VISKLWLQKALVIAATVWGILLACGTPAAATIRYTVSLAQPEEQLLHVTMTVPDVKGELIVQLPAWNALYQIRDFSQRVQDVRAVTAASVAKLDKHTWRITGDGEIRIQYAIFWDEPGAFSSEFNSAHAFLNLAGVLFYVPDRRGESVVLEFADVPAGWSIAAALPNAAASTSFKAESYDALVDAPVEAGVFEEWRFEAGKARIRVVVHGTGWNREQLTDGIRKIVAYQTEMMRDVPFEEFLFIYHFGVGGGGGMEHSNSTAIHLSANAPFASITAHEFFHLWNVKRIRPQGLEPGCPQGCPSGRGVDYTRENWTRSLWFAEGVTSTYAAFTLVRAGLITPQQYYADLGNQINFLQARPARLWKSAEEASLDAWLERYPLYNRPAHSISYYNKGQLLGALLDILIRDATDNRASLDDVLRHLNEHFARRNRFYAEGADLRAAVEKVAGRSFEDFFARYVSGTDELPYREVLALAGLELASRGQTRADLGFTTGRGPGDAAVVARVEQGTEAARAGLRAGDVLLELEGSAFPRNTARWLAARRPGETIRVKVQRSGETLEFAFALGGRAESAFEVREMAQPSEKQRRIREGIVSGIPR